MKLISSIFINLLIISFLFGNIEDTTSLKSNFIQRVTNDQGSIIEYKGEVFATKGNLALWSYISPVNKQIFYNNGNVVVIEPELEQAIFSKLDKIPNLFQILKSAKKISNNKLLAKCCSNTYTITTNNGKIDKIEYKDEMDNFVTIKFYNQRLNEKIDRSVFTYKIPKHYDLLKQ